MSRARTRASVHGRLFNCINYYFTSIVRAGARVKNAITASANEGAFPNMGAVLCRVSDFPRLKKQLDTIVPDRRYRPVGYVSRALSVIAALTRAALSFKVNRPRHQSKIKSFVTPGGSLYAQSNDSRCGRHYRRALWSPVTMTVTAPRARERRGTVNPFAANLQINHSVNSALSRGSRAKLGRAA